MTAYDPPGLPPPRKDSTGFRDYDVELALSYRRVLTVPATCPQHAEEVALQRLEAMAPEIFEDAQIIVKSED